LLKGLLLIALFFLSVIGAASYASAMPLFSGASKQALFLSPLEAWMPTWNLEEYVSQLEHAGYHVDVLLNENVSISFLKTGLANYDLIILRTDSFFHEGIHYYCSGEPVTYQTSTVFANEISSHELQVGACLAFSVVFLEDNYPAGSLRHGLVYAIGSTTDELSDAFLSGGSAVFLGYDATFRLDWGQIDALSIMLFTYMSQGYSVEDAMNQLNMYLYTGHGTTNDWLLPYWTGDGNFKI
jgi:hypothetical protein